MLALYLSIPLFFYFILKYIKIYSNVFQVKINHSTNADLKKYFSRILKSCLRKLCNRKGFYFERWRKWHYFPGYLLRRGQLTSNIVVLTFLQFCNCTGVTVEVTKSQLQTIQIITCCSVGAETSWKQRSSFFRFHSQPVSLVS